MGASTAVALGAIINQATGNASYTLNPNGARDADGNLIITNPRSLEQQQAVTQLIGKLAGAVAATTGVDAPSAVVAATLEVENNLLDGIRLRPCGKNDKGCFTDAEFLRNPAVAGANVVALINQFNLTRAEALACLKSKTECLPIQNIKDKLIEREASLGASTEEIERINNAKLADLPAIDSELKVKENDKRIVDGLKASSDPSAQKLGNALAGTSAEVRAEIFKDIKDGRGSGAITQALGKLGSLVLNEDQQISVLIKDAELRLAAKNGIQDYQTGVRAQAQAERDGLKGKVDAVRAKFGDAAATVYELKERERISAEESFRLNFASSGQSLLEFTKDPERNGTAALKNTALGIAKTIDAIIMDDRNPAEIYRDVKAKLGIEIANWDKMTREQQADAIGRLRGNLSAEITKVVATGGTAAVGRGLIARGAVETAEGAAVRGLFDKANDPKTPGTPDVDAPNAPDTRGNNPPPPPPPPLDPLKEVTQLFDPAHPRGGIQIGNRSVLPDPVNRGGAKIFDGVSELEVKQYFEKLTGQKLPTPTSVPGGLVYVIKTPTGNFNLRTVSSSSGQTGARFTIDVPGSMVGVRKPRVELKFR